MKKEYNLTKMKKRKNPFSKQLNKEKKLPPIPHTEEEYNDLVSILDELIDLVGEDEEHPLASLMGSIGSLIEAYENKNVPFLEETSAGDNYEKR